MVVYSARCLCMLDRHVGLSRPFYVNKIYPFIHQLKGGILGVVLHLQLFGFLHDWPGAQGLSSYTCALECMYGMYVFYEQSSFCLYFTSVLFHKDLQTLPIKK